MAEPELVCSTKIRELVRDVLDEHQRHTSSLRAEIVRLRQLARTDQDLQPEKKSGVTREQVPDDPSVITPPAVRDVSSARLWNNSAPWRSDKEKDEESAREKAEDDRRRAVEELCKSASNNQIVEQRLESAPKRMNAGLPAAKQAKKVTPEMRKFLNGMQTQGSGISEMPPPVATLPTDERCTGMADSQQFTAAMLDDEVDTVKLALKRAYVPRSFSGRLVTFVNWIEDLSEPPRLGTLARIVKSDLFSCVVLSVVLLNAVLIVINSNIEMERALKNNAHWAQWYGKTAPSSEIDWRQGCEFFFHSFFIIELSLRLIVHRGYFFVNEDFRWNIMDLSLVVFGAFELAMYLYAITGAAEGPSLNLAFIRLLRVLKIVKVFRVLRAVEYIAELQLMLDCVMNSMLQLCWCVIMIICMLYMFSLVFVQTLSEYVTHHQLDDAVLLQIENGFGTVRKSMISCFQATTGGLDWKEQFDLFDSVGAFAGFLYLFFIAFFIVAVTNIVTSTFVEKVFKLAMPNLEELIRAKHKQDTVFAKELFEVLSATMDDDGDGVIKLSEFQRNMGNPRLTEFFSVRGLDLKDKESFFSMLSQMGHDDDEVDLKTFVGCAVRLQGGATSIDLQTSHFDLKKSLVKQTKQMAQLEKLLNEVLHMTCVVDSDVLAAESLFSPAKASAECLPDVRGIYYL